jgi:hypothetical protein
LYLLSGGIDAPLKRPSSSTGIAGPLSTFSFVRTGSISFQVLGALPQLDFQIIGIRNFLILLNYTFSLYPYYFIRLMLGIIMMALWQIIRLFRARMPSALQNHVG